MDMVAAIQAAKNQLEEQKKKRGNGAAAAKPAVSPVLASLHPPPPATTISFDSKKSLRRKTSDLDSSPRPHHDPRGGRRGGERDYVLPEYQYGCDDGGGDDASATSTLSGTLPSVAAHDAPPSGPGGAGALRGLDIIRESPGSASPPSGSRGPLAPPAGGDGDRASPPRGGGPRAGGSAPDPPPGGGGGAGPRQQGTSGFRADPTGDASAAGAVVAGRSLLDADALPNNGATSNSDVSKKIEEIMSAYQGKVDNILKRRDETAAFKTVAESARGDSASGVSSSPAEKTRRLGGVAVEPAGRSGAAGERPALDDILSTYKKKVEEIMEKQPSAASRDEDSYDDDTERRRREESATSWPSYPRSIADDEGSESGEGAADDGSVTDSRSGRSGGRGGSGRSRSGSPGDPGRRGSSRGSSSGSGSYGGSGSYSGGNGTDGEGEIVGEVDDNKPLVGRSNDVTSAVPPATTKSRPMSERANAVWQSCSDDNKQKLAPVSSARSLSPPRNPVEPQSPDRSYSGEESYSSRDSYISGASSASDALSAAIEGGGGPSYNPEFVNEEQPPQDEAVDVDDEEVEGPPNAAVKPLYRKDSLKRAQEHLARKMPKKTTKSFYCEPNSTKSKLHEELETERKYRQDLERRLTESARREDDLSNENRRLEKSLADLQAQLEKVQGESRNNKYSQSEQAARIRELERKLKGEQNRVEELEREKETMKEEYDADLEEQKDINRQLEQMVMSEEFEKELEDEINQVKELEHANRRFKVKIDMLEREKNTITKKFEVKIEELTNKNKTMEDQLAEFESKASTLETTNRNTVMELESKLAQEANRVRELELSTDSAASKFNSKLKVMEMEMAELRETSSKIDEYEQVLGKLMERNTELETEAKSAREERDMANRQVELSDRRRAVKVKDLEEQVAEQKLMIDQQQETLDESVKTILKLYSLNNGKGDDMTTMSEEQLDSIARAMIPRAPTKPSLPALNERPRAGMDRARSRGRDRLEELEMEKTVSRAVARAQSRGRDRFDETEKSVTRALARTQSRGRDRFDEAETEKSIARSTARSLRPRSQGRERFEELEIDKSVSRAKSRGRGDRRESIHALTSRALDKGRENSRSPLPVTRRQSSGERKYDPNGPNSLALVPVMTKQDEFYGSYDMPPPRSSSRRRGGSSSVFDRVDSTYTDGESYSNALVDYESINRPRHPRSNHHQPNNDRERNRYVDRDDQSRGNRKDRHRDRDDRSRGGKSHRDDRYRDRHDRGFRDDRGDDKSRGGRSHREDRHRERGKGGGWDERPQSRDSRHRGGGYYEEESFKRSLYGNDGGRPHDRGRHRPRGGSKHQSRREP